MPSAADGDFQLEFGQNASAGVEQLTDAGDAKSFYSGTSMGAKQWSRANGRDPVVVIDGVINGFVITPSAAADQVDISAGLYNRAGSADQSLAASSGVAVARPSTDTHLISAITVSTGDAIAVFQGTEGTAFSDTLGAAGGPPYVPVDAILLGYVRYSAQASAVIDAASIQAIDGISRESATYPFYDREDIYENGGITFNAALAALHTGDVTKKVYASYYEPVLAPVKLGKDFSPPYESTTQSTDTRYQAVTVSETKTLNTGAINFVLDDGVNDPVLKARGDWRWAEFRPNVYKPAFLRGLVKLSGGPAFPTESDINIDLTLLSAKEWTQHAS